MFFLLFFLGVESQIPSVQHQPQQQQQPQHHPQLSQQHSLYSQQHQHQSIQQPTLSSLPHHIPAHHQSPDCDSPFRYQSMYQTPPHPPPPSIGQSSSAFCAIGQSHHDPTGKYYSFFILFKQHNHLTLCTTNQPHNLFL